MLSLNIFRMNLDKNIDLFRDFENFQILGKIRHFSYERILV